MKTNSIKSKIRWLRVSYWIAAIADFAIAVSVLVPDRVGLTEFVYPMGLMSAVAISWGILLVVADRKPIERKWVLIPTIIVVALLSGVRIYAVINDLIKFSLVYLIAGIAILVLLIYTYSISKGLKVEN